VPTSSLPEGIELFSTCPPSSGSSARSYVQRVEEVARWVDEAGYRGLLVYTDNRLVDPWLVAQLVLQATTSLRPLVAVQPVYLHPFAAAKKVASLAFLHGRPIDLNMLAGGFKNDLVALGDETPHGERYARTVEYTEVLKLLLSTRGAASFEGRFYRLVRATLGPALPPELFPGLLISGSSEAGLAAARAIGATAIRYPEPAADEDDWSGSDLRVGIRVGVIARPSSEDAWRAAHERFPPDRKGQIAHALAMRVSDSQWHRRLSETEEPAGSPYWLHPFRNYQTFCPYLVGSYEEVGAELGRYYTLGFRSFILDVPVNRDDLEHVERAFVAAAQWAGQVARV
jgi:alkanesulfonate monooxygenase